MRAIDRHRLAKLNEPPPPRFITILGAELRDGWRSLQFWMALVRHSIPVVGVFFFHWQALQMAFYFLLQSWLMGSLYGAIDMTFNPKEGTPPRDLFDALGALSQRFFVLAIFFAFIVGIFGVFMLTGFFDKHELQAFLAGGWMQSSFMSGLLALAIGCFSEAIRFLRSLPHRTSAQIEADNFRFAATVQTVALMCAASILLGIFNNWGWGPPLFVVTAALVLLLFDVAPRSAALLIGTRKPSVDAA